MSIANDCDVKHFVLKCDFYLCKVNTFVLHLVYKGGESFVFAHTECLLYIDG